MNGKIIYSENNRKTIKVRDNSELGIITKFFKTFKDVYNLTMLEFEELLNEIVIELQKDLDKTLEDKLLEGKENDKRR